MWSFNEVVEFFVKFLVNLIKFPLKTSWKSNSSDSQVNQQLKKTNVETILRLFCVEIFIVFDCGWWNNFAKMENREIIFQRLQDQQTTVVNCSWRFGDLKPISPVLFKGKQKNRRLQTFFLATNKLFTETIINNDPSKIPFFRCMQLNWKFVSLMLALKTETGKLAHRKRPYN